MNTYTSEQKAAMSNLPRLDPHSLVRAWYGDPDPRRPACTQCGGERERYEFDSNYTQTWVRLVCSLCKGVDK